MICHLLINNINYCLSNKGDPVIDTLKLKETFEANGFNNAQACSRAVWETCCATRNNKLMCFFDVWQAFHFKTQAHVNWRKCVDVFGFVVSNPHIAVVHPHKIAHGIGQEGKNTGLLTNQKDRDDDAKQRANTFGLVEFDEFEGGAQ